MQVAAPDCIAMAIAELTFAFAHSLVVQVLASEITFIRISPVKNCVEPWDKRPEQARTRSSKPTLLEH